MKNKWLGAGHSHGFSLVEMMIVVSVIALLAQLAVPKFQMFMAKARQAEAKTNLNHIHALEVSYHAENGTYVDFPYVGRFGTNPDACTFPATNPIGFHMSGGCSKIRYNYSVIFSSDTFFHGVAVGAPGLIVPGCDKRDFWYIDPEKVTRSWQDGPWGDPVVLCF